MDIVSRLYIELHPLMRIACGVLIAFALGLGAWMWRGSRKATGILGIFQTALSHVVPLEKTERRRGLALSTVEKLRCTWRRTPDRR